MKSLVLCCDGTWNTADQRTDGKLCPTNVVKIAYRLARRDEYGAPQILFYDQGVGTGNLLDKYSGGAFGDGLDDNIWDAYRFLIANYEEGDRIYLFGFSRGAFTARSIAGMIRKCGILKRLTVENYVEAIRLYRSLDHPDEPLCERFRESHSVGGTEFPPIVSMIGVWDTVGALGIPGPVRGLTTGKYKFHDTELSNIVQRAYHAVSIDERRAAFEPTLWTPDRKEVLKRMRVRSKSGQVRTLRSIEKRMTQIVEQVWFAGVHTDVGGGYAEVGLSDIALKWMMAKAKLAGLAFDDEVVRSHPLHESVTGPLHDSKTGAYAVVPDFNRTIGLTIKSGKSDHTQRVHPSVRERVRKDHDYRPGQLREYFKRHDDPILKEVPVW